MRYVAELERQISDYVTEHGRRPRCLRMTAAEIRLLDAEVGAMSAVASPSADIMPFDAPWDFSSFRRMPCLPSYANVDIVEVEVVGRSRFE